MQTALHVALVTETWRPEINGVAMTLGRMADGLLAGGHRITLTRPRQPGDDTGTATNRSAGLREVLVAGCPLPGYRGLRFGLPARARLLREWRADRPDIVQIATEGPLGASALAAARALGIPAISEFHTNFHAYSRHYGLGWLEGLVAAHLRRLHNRSAVTLAPTLAMADSLRASGYRQVRVVSRGVDTALFHPSRRSAALRAQWGLRRGGEPGEKLGERQGEQPDEQPGGARGEQRNLARDGQAGATDDGLVVAYVGRLAAEKNLPLVERSFAAIRAVRPDARLLYVGDGPLRARLQRSRPEHIFAGMRRDADLAAHYASADLFLFPSLTETFGNVTTEALASGLAVVAYDCAAAAEVIEHDRNGRLVPSGDADAFVAVASALAADRAALARLRAQAAPSVAQLDWARINDHLVEVMREVIAGAATAPTPAPQALAGTHLPS